jgi:tetratricopeptide (TPR) repeat protein
MDALKKAEQAKRQAQAGGVQPAAPIGVELELTPLEGTSPASTAGIQLDELNLEALDGQFEAHAASKFRNEPPRRTSAAMPPAAAPAAAAEDRAAARNVFEAKKTKAPSKLFGIVVAILTLIAAAAIAIYFWLQLAQPGSSLLAPATPAAGRPAGQVPPAAATPSKPIASLPAMPESAPAAQTAPTRKPRPAKPAATAPLPSSDGDAPIRISAGRLQVNPALSRAYDAFAAGDLTTAQRLYEQVLQGDGKNSDALLGLAAIQLRQGQPAAAEDFYLRTLEADPRNALAQAGLIALHSRGDPVQAEAHLQSLIATQPDLPSLHFVLGNVYARQSRWNEAQREYFKAYSADTDNPDYLFNLAVSLDRLRQPKLAAQYYNQALAAAANRQATFDRAQVTARLHELQQ